MIIQSHIASQTSCSIKNDAFTTIIQYFPFPFTIGNINHLKLQSICCLHWPCHPKYENRILILIALNEESYELKALTIWLKNGTNSNGIYLQTNWQQNINDGFERCAEKVEKTYFAFLISLQMYKDNYKLTISPGVLKNCFA